MKLILKGTEKYQYGKKSFIILVCNAGITLGKGKVFVTISDMKLSDRLRNIK